MSTYKLRKFRGIADLERRILLPEGSPERHGLARDSDLVSLDLFGITRADTLYLGQPDLSSIENFNAEADWESHFDFLHAKHYETLHHMFGELDWNISNGEYKYLQCTALFDRQIICAARGLIGHLPDDSKIARSKVQLALKILSGMGKSRRTTPNSPTAGLAANGHRQRPLAEIIQPQIPEADEDHSGPALAVPRQVDRLPAAMLIPGRSVR